MTGTTDDIRRKASSHFADIRRKASSHFSLVTDASETTLVTDLPPQTTDPCVTFHNDAAAPPSRYPNGSLSVGDAGPPPSRRPSQLRTTLQRITTRICTAPARHISKHRPFLHKAHNEVRYAWGDFVRIRGSIIPHVVAPTLVLTAWSILWCLLYKSGGWQWTNTAYDRYWEGRRTWGTLLTQVRNLARLVWIGVPADGHPEVSEQKKGCLALLLAFTVATKHYLRNEPGANYDDLRHLLQHLPDFAPHKSGPETDNLPLEISFHLSSYINNVKDTGKIEAGPFLAMTNASSSMIECLSSFERIRNSPIPMAYHVHLRQTLWLYLLSLPFQTIQAISWGTVPLVMLASFTMLGIDSIGRQIEDPFGYDDNDLPVDAFCEDTERELGELMDAGEVFSPERWGVARDMIKVEERKVGVVDVNVGGKDI
ncbi:hypothetical protein HDV00_010166 [Rhizophlyctis rosea]|nr:hypothetical protein HDV00_010166 [Rhizophlyctis rosea]